MTEIKVERQIEKKILDKEAVFEWPIWEKEASEFSWAYDAEETCYFLQGEVVVTPDNGEPVSMGEGDLVTFPAGMSCHWLIKNEVRKHYKFT